MINVLKLDVKAYLINLMLKLLTSIPYLKKSPIYLTISLIKFLKSFKIHKKTLKNMD